MSVELVSDPIKVLLRAIETDPVAFARLKDKAHWENMSIVGILERWGDPRTWEPPAHPPSK
jgi:hypothetical protein